MTDNAPIRLGIPLAALVVASLDVAAPEAAFHAMSLRTTVKAVLTVVVVSTAAISSVVLFATRAPRSQEPPDSDASPREGETPSQTVYRLGLAPADVDTSLEVYMDLPRGITEQCDVLNDLVQSDCCREFDIGCNVRYVCDHLSVDARDRMSQAAHLYARENAGEPAYAVHHGAVQRRLTSYLRTLQLYGRLERTLPVAYTRHPIIVDDEETKIRRNKIDRTDTAMLLLGSILPGVSARGGTRMRLDYYASRNGLLLSTSPLRASSLAQAVAEYRKGLFSLQGKQLTGRGARDLFELADGQARPRLSACQALAVLEPNYLRYLIQASPDAAPGSG